ncbi:hypothetical protein ACFVZP_36870, partial [Streptomyces bottropensis]
MTLPFEVGVVVRDLEAMERFYGDVLGCRAVRRSRVPESVGGPAGLGGELLVVWLQVPSGGCVKLLLPSSPPSLPVPVVSRGGGGAPARRRRGGPGGAGSRGPAPRGHTGSAPPPPPGVYAAAAASRAG